jgi:hypothetical protein
LGGYVPNGSSCPGKTRNTSELFNAAFVLQFAELPHHHLVAQRTGWLLIGRDFRDLSRHLQKLQT